MVREKIVLHSFACEGESRYAPQSRAFFADPGLGSEDEKDRQMHMQTSEAESAVITTSTITNRELRKTTNFEISSIRATPPVHLRIDASECCAREGK